MRSGFVLSTVCVFALLAARPASAQMLQPWTDRGYANLNIAFETASGVLTDARGFDIYGENAVITSASTVDSGSLFDFSLGSRVWRNVSVGIGFHRGSTSGEGAVTGQIPHPLLFGAPRALAVNVSDLDRDEQAFHLQVGYMLVLTDRIDVHVTLGPSFFRLKQDVVEGVSLEEQGGTFSSIAGSPQIVDRTDSPVGFNIGADLAYRLYDSADWRVGIGLLVRYAGASADVRLLENTVDSDVGGLQIGFGGRVRF